MGLKKWHFSKRGWLAAVAVLVSLVIAVRMLISWAPTMPEGVAESAAPPAALDSREPTVPPADRPPGPAAEIATRSGEARSAEHQQAPPREGIHVFPPLGTRQLLSGIMVPEGFELPPGYIRHRQTSDDGELLPPILMFHPHEAPVDWRGIPIPVTADRIVPPEHAPEGMPIVMFEAPRSGPPSTGLSRFLERN